MMVQRPRCNRRVIASRFLAFPLSMLLLGVTGCAVSQQDTDPGQESRQDVAQDESNCVQVTRVDNTEVLDERTILFHMQNGDILQNALPQRCNGLNNYDAFSYSISTTQLCTADTITVLQRIGPGVGFTPMASCQLGPFEPVTDTAQSR